MTAPSEATYVIDDRQWVVETPDVRVYILILGSGQEVPWHSHTAVTDSFACLGGLMVVKTLDVAVGHEL